jgi:hypothetical protein
VTSVAPPQSVQLHDDGPVPPPSIYSASAHSQQPSSSPFGGHAHLAASSQRLVDLDKIDEIDETDPSGHRWHTTGPYDAIGSVLGTGSRAGGSTIGSPRTHRRQIHSISGISAHRPRDYGHSRDGNTSSPYPPGTTFIPESLPPDMAKAYSDRSGQHTRTATQSTAPAVLQRFEDQSPIEPQAAHHAPQSRDFYEEPSGDTYFSNETHVSNPDSFEREADDADSEGGRRRHAHAHDPHREWNRNASGPIPVPPPHHSRDYDEQTGEFGRAPSQGSRSGRYTISNGRISYANAPSAGRGGGSPPHGSPHGSRASQGSVRSRGSAGSQGSFFQAGASRHPAEGHPPEDHYYARGEYERPLGHHDRDSQQFYSDGPPEPRVEAPSHEPSEHSPASRQQRRSFDRGSYGAPPPGEFLDPHDVPARTHSQYTHDEYGASDHGHAPEPSDVGSHVTYEHAERRHASARSPQGSVLSGGSRAGGPPPRHLPRTLVMPSSLQGGQGGFGPPSVASSGYRGRTYESPRYGAPNYPRDVSRARSPRRAEHVPMGDGMGGRLKKKR